MPLIEKEIIAPGTYFYTDEKSGLPRKLDVDSALTKYWLDQGTKMLDFGLKVPVPYEHDFQINPMTPKDKLLNNAGEVKEYRIRDILKGDPLYDAKRGEVKDALFGIVDVQDPHIRDKIGTSIRWTSPWINSFMDGDGRQWKNVIAHLALTTKPRITSQSPFTSIAAALSMATPAPKPSADGYCLTRAGLLLKGLPAYPLAFSLMSGVALGFPPPKKKGKDDKAKKPTSEGGEPDSNPTPAEGEPPGKPGEGGEPGEGGPPGAGDDIDLPPLGDQAGDVSMEEVLCDLLRALGVDCQHDGDESQFKRNLYAAAMKKVHELTNKGMNKDEDPKPGSVNKGNPPGQQPPNPLVQQEQQPMYMSLEEINKIPDQTTKGIALSWYNENVKAEAKTAELEKKLNGLNNKVITEHGSKRSERVARLSRISPKVKADLEAMVAMPSMALSMGDDGNVVDPMEQTLKILENGLADMPQLLQIPAAALGVSPHPVDDVNALTAEQEQKIVDDMVRMQGGVPFPKAG